MAKKSVKTKVLSGVVAVGLLSGVSAAFASTDVGTQLQDWYNGKFKAAGASMQKPLEEYAASKVPGIVRDGKSMMAGATTAINGTRDTAINTASGNIDTATQGYIDALKAKEGQISAGIEGQFDWIKGIAEGMLNQMATEGQTQAERILSSHATSKGNAALGQVQSELDTAKEEALADLNGEIDRAKRELEAKLNAEKDATVGELKTAIDNKISEVKSYLEGRLAEFVQTQQNLITAKAQELENAAKGELDQAVVDGLK